MLASGQLFYTATTMKSTSICCSIILAIIVHVVPGSGLALRSDLAIIKVTEELKMIVASRNKANTLENQSEGARNLACDSVRGSQIKLIVLHVSAGHPSSTRCPPL